MICLCAGPLLYPLKFVNCGCLSLQIVALANLLPADDNVDELDSFSLHVPDCKPFCTLRVSSQQVLVAGL
jgi:hypothetical protein